jgi:Arc/MetJ family transcription regulator
MTRTVIELDEDKLAQVAQILGTTTKVGTVNAALEDVIKRRRRESFVAWLKDGGLPDLTDPKALPESARRTA